MATIIKGFASDWSVPEPAKAALDGLYDKVDPQGRQPVRKGELFTNVKDHGVTGNGTTDDTAAIQALIDATHAAKGGTLFFPAGTYRIGTLVLKESVVLQGFQTVHGYGPTGTGSTRFRSTSNGNGWMIDITGSRAGVRDLDVWGEYGVTYGGVRVAGHNVQLNEIHFNNFLGPAVQITTGNACTVDNILAFNCLLDRAPAADIGVMDIGGNDHYITRVEANCSLSAISSSNLRCSAWVIRGVNNFFSNCVGEFSDRGYLVLGSKNRFTGMRADRNFGIGWEIRGASNAFAACQAVDNSRGVTDTYPAFLTSGQGNTFAACSTSYLSNEMPTYAFEDTTANASPASRNSYAACSGRAVRATFKGDAYLGSSFEVPNHVVRVTGNPTVLPVDQSGFHMMTYTAATTVTGFSGGHSGQQITLLGWSGPVTLAHSSTLQLRGKRNIVLGQGRAYRFVHYNGAWYEVSGGDVVSTSPNGTSYRINVADDGTLSTTAI